MMTKTRQLSIFYFLVGLPLSVVALLVLIEGSVRLFFPEINHQDTSRSLFREHAYGNSAGWKPNAVGVSFGEPVVIDDSGFRKMSSPVAMKKKQDSVLILGDSVMFGVGVPAEATVADRLQRDCKETKIWNTSVVGYSVQNYLDVFNHFMIESQKPSTVLVFLTQNDVYGYLTGPLNGASSVSETVFGVMRQHSKLYMYLKNHFFDRSKHYFIGDYGYYNEGNKDFSLMIGRLSEMADVASRWKIKFSVFILPYEYQLRSKDRRYLQPQIMLTAALRARNIDAVDLYEDFVSAADTSPGGSKDLYLYADPMHFSSMGHLVAYRAIHSVLRRINVCTN